MSLQLIQSQTGYPLMTLHYYSYHPYLFFNADGGGSFTFLGWNINKRNGDLVNTKNQTVLESRIMHPDLAQDLEDNRVNLTEDYDKLPR